MPKSGMTESYVGQFLVFWGTSIVTHIVVKQVIFPPTVYEVCIFAPYLYKHFFLFYKNCKCGWVKLES
jgi:hypothetical protein